MYEDSLNDFNYSFNYNQNLIDLNEEFTIDNNKENKSEDDDEEFEEGQKWVMYDIIQANYTQMRNSLLMIQKILIKNQDFSSNINQNEEFHILSKNNFPKDNSNDDKNEANKKKVKNAKKIHSKFNDDLIFIKIKVLYHKFLISVSNDGYNSCESSLSNKKFLKNLSSKITHNSGKDYNKKLGDLSLKEFLSMPISCQYSNYKESTNKKNIMNLYKEPTEKYKNLINLLNCNYKYFFKNFYIKQNCIELIEQNYNIKRKTFITFNESIQKLVKKESMDYISKVIEFAKEKFIWYLEGKRSKKKIIDYDIKLNDLFNISCK